MIENKIREQENQLQNNRNEEEHDDQSNPLLIAPPLIDIIWVCMIRLHDVYSNFCDHIFGKYVDRNYPTGISETEYSSYTKTLELLDRNADIIGPFHNFWPRYNAS